MIKTRINEKEKSELESLRNQTSKKESEKALMILLNSEGKNVKEISRQLHRHEHTVRTWIKRYNANKSEGLKRLYSPGRPSKRKTQVIPKIEEYMNKSPEDYGYKKKVWTVNIIKDLFYKETKEKISEDTIERGMKDSDYTYKRNGKTIPQKAPSKEEKKEQIKKIINEIKNVTKDKETEIFLLDESHFSTEPYIQRTWSKKKWPPADTDSGKKRKSHNIWCVESKKGNFLLEAISYGQ